jgi:Arc/MetJ-type ribon-helix-helix transcriptional regulator
MTIQIAIRLDEGELAALDTEVTAGRAANRSDAVRRGIARMQREQRYRDDEATLIDLARRGEPVYPDLDGLLDHLPHPPLD